MVRPDGEPLTVVEHGGRLLLDPELLDGIEGAEEWEAGDPFAYAYGELLVHDTARDQWWFPDSELAPRMEALGDGRHRVVVAGETVIDPLTLAGGSPMEPGTHQVWVSAQFLGVGRRPRLTPAQGRYRQPLGAVAVGKPPRIVVPGWAGPGGQFRLDVGLPGRIGAPRSLLLRAAAHHRLRRGARAMLRRLPDGVSRKVRAVALRADRWTRS